MQKYGHMHTNDRICRHRTPAYETMLPRLSVRVIPVSSTMLPRLSVRFIPMPSCRPNAPRCLPGEVAARASVRDRASVRPIERADLCLGVVCLIIGEFKILGDLGVFLADCRTGLSSFSGLSSGKLFRFSRGSTLLEIDFLN